MTRLPRVLCVSLICLLVTLLAIPASLSAQQRDAQDSELQQAVENFWHYGKIARYDLARTEAQNILAKRDDPLAVLEAFEATAGQRNDDIDRWMLRWQGTDELRETSNQLIALLNEGRRARRADPAWIEDNVQRLSRPGRPHALAVERLRDSGELAVPIMIDYLRDPNRTQYHDGIRKGMRAIARPALNPLLASTEMKQQDALIQVISIIGDIGYNVSVPYLARLANGEDQPSAVRSAATQALLRMGVSNPSAIVPADAFYELAEKFYYDNAEVTADRRDPDAMANMWFWDEQKGLVRIQVAPAIFNELMAMRATEYAMKLGDSRGDALSLWLAANYKREVELPDGQVDRTRGEGQPDAHFYGVDSGTRYLNSALSRALRDRDHAVALKVIKSLQMIVGQSNLFDGNIRPLVEAMDSPDRAVRFEAAFAVAASLPTQSFIGQERVVPLLAEAVSQTGVPSAVIVMAQQNQANAMVDEFKRLNYNAIGATSADAAISAAAQLASVDVMLISEDIGTAEVDKLLSHLAASARLGGAARVIVTQTTVSPYAVRAIDDPLLSVTQATEPQGLRRAADEARARASSIAIDPEIATDYALRSAQLVEMLATSRSVLDLTPAEMGLLNALRDNRPEVVMSAGSALSLIDSRDAQGAVLAVALDNKTGEDVKVSLYRSLARHAKFFGNRLGADDVSKLDEVVESDSSLEVRSAAAEARGALNLPPDQAKELILRQSRM